MKNETPFYDVIIVGAGISGVGAAYHIQDKCPHKSIAILEARENMGGTWDLFKYPGIRSDSDMYTLGFSFNPWRNPKAIADGPSILQYVKDTAAKFGIDKKIQFNSKATDASWSDKDKMWTITVNGDKKLQCKFLFMCSGYYDYENGYTPEFPGIENFKGTVVHPQHWDTSLDYTDKKVVIIGSGATAITLAPEMSKKAGRVVMLQRSPTYVVNLPGEDVTATFMRKFLPEETTYDLVRWKNILLSLGFYNASRRWPNAIKKFIALGVKKELGENFDMKHFEPKYNPWDQRLCVVPDSDLFKAIKKGKLEVVTDTIKTFTSKGILLESGEELEADIIVTATGLKLQMLGGMTMHINGKQGKPGDTHCYRGVMFSDVPNFALAVGYTNASWTLKCELSCLFVTRILNHMEKHHFDVCVPRFDPALGTEPFLDLNSGYVQRSYDIMPKQGKQTPWKVYQNYIKDTFSLKYTKLQDKFLEYR